MTEEKENKENLPVVKPHIPIENGQLVPQDAAGLFYLASVMSKTKMVPDTYRGDPQATFVAIQLGMEVGMRPMAALQNIAVIKGKPTIYADGITGLLHGSGKCDEIREWFEIGGEKKIDTSDLDRDVSKWPDNLKAVSVIVRKKPDGHKGIEYRGTFSVADAKRMGTWNSKDVWKKFPARMLMWRARTYAARDGFSDVLKGLGVFEEVIDYDADLEPQNGHYGVPEEVVEVATVQDTPQVKSSKPLFDEMCESRGLDPQKALDYCKEINKITGAPILSITSKAITKPDSFEEKFKEWLKGQDDGDPMGIDEEPENTAVRMDPFQNPADTKVHGPDEDPFQDPPAAKIDEDGFSADMPEGKKAEVQARTAGDDPGEAGSKKVDHPAADEGGGADSSSPSSKKSFRKKWIGLRGVDFKDYVPAHPDHFEGISSSEYKDAVDKWNNLVKPRYNLDWPIGSTEKQGEIEFPQQSMRQHLAEMKKDYPEEVKKVLKDRKFANGALSEDAAKIAVQDVIEILGGKQIQ